MVAVTGTGIVTAIGNNLAENIDALKKQQSGIALVKDIPNTRKNFLVGQILLSNQDLKTMLDIDAKASIPRTTLLALLAAKEALGTSSLGTDTGLKTGLISSTSTGGMDLTEEFYQAYLTTNDISQINKLATHDNGQNTLILSEKLGVSQNIFTLSTACSSSANAILTGARMIEAGMVDRILVGGSDALTNFTMNGFDSLMIYDSDICKPFDQNRKGLNLGEGAGFLLLENEKSLSKSQNEVIGHVVGWGNANDAYHQTASSPEGTGATIAIQQALQKARISSSAIDYVNAHGTATPNNDKSESVALVNIFGNQVPDFSSTKGYTGHTLAASGAVEAIFSLKAIQNNEIYANANFQTQMEDSPLTPLTDNKKKEVNHVLSNSFGFGGNCSSLILSS